MSDNKNHVAAHIIAAMNSTTQPLPHFNSTQTMAIFLHTND
ncbi:hypothetical protein C3B55_00817 [Candidatus Pseudomonas adelgestsugas]|uniref:Uncharacterized protein n=1 Tax=Candidatus Pseudomonas adelgestsugas TaxID=1302376 RepID=A0ABX5R9B0_9PSED|nr:hypothetical protein C3B55_00817 [Candidatus Pseudomonas adelgestsugas]